ncbi:hypothetical protein HDU98_005766 [Podochytrium sp. JEL0797]|nr:hypothetical protein HDU98_005766 [Podochytrium sp. JEL0797]
MKLSNILLFATFALAAPSPIDKSTSQVVQKRNVYCVTESCREGMRKMFSRDDASVPEAVPDLPSAVVVASVVEEPVVVIGEAPATVEETAATHKRAVDPVTGEPVKRARWCMQQFCAMMNPGRRDGEEAGVEAPVAARR